VRSNLVIKKIKTTSNPWKKFSQKKKNPWEKYYPLADLRVSDCKE